MMLEFPSRKRKRSTLCHLIKRIDETGKIDRQKGAADRNLQEQQRRVIETENWLPNSPRLNPVYYSVWGPLQQIVHSQSHNLRHWPADTHANWLLGSAKPGHIELSDQSAA